MWWIIGFILLFGSVLDIALAKNSGDITRQEEAEQAKKQMKQGCDSDGC